MTKLKFKAFFALSIFLAAQPADSAVCKTTTIEGETAFLFKKDKSGKPIITKYLIEEIPSMALCPEKLIEIRKPKILEYTVTNPQNDCEKSARLACEPSFGGLPICTTNNFANFCGFCLVTTKATTGMGDVTMRYINGQIYSGDKPTPDGVNGCLNQQLIK